jgi:hypothetical protein
MEQFSSNQVSLSLSNYFFGFIIKKNTNTSIPLFGEAVHISW